MRLDPISGRLDAGDHPRVPRGLPLALALAGALAAPGLSHGAVTAVMKDYLQGTKYAEITSSANDVITVACAAGLLKISGADPTGGAFPCDLLGAILVDGGALGDTLDLSGLVGSDFPRLDMVGSTLAGTAAADVFIGSELGEAYDGGGGGDVVHGNGGDDELFALNGLLEGGAGDDTLRGQSSATTLDGGSGRDTYVHDKTGFAAVDVTLTDSALTGDATHPLTGVEVVRFSGGIAADRLDARAFTGDVVFEGKAGNDTFLGGTGEDTIVAEQVAGAATLSDAALVGPSGANAVGTDTIQFVERARITGNSTADTLDAGAFTGDATLVGGGGADVLTGGAGRDELEPGDGPDSVAGGPERDVVVGQGSGALTLTPTTLLEDGTTDALSGIEAARLSGLAGADSITSSSFGGDVTVVATGGSDSVAVGAGTSDVVRASGSVVTLGASTLAVDGSTTTFGGIERAELLGNDRGAPTRPASLGRTHDATGFPGAVTFTGGDGGDVLTGGSGPDLFEARGGNDRIDGGPGTDSVTVRTQGDALLSPTLVSGQGSDALVSIEAAALLGGAAPQTFTLAGWLGMAEIDAAGGGDTYAVSFGPAGIARIAIQDSGGDGIDTIVVPTCVGVLQVPETIAFGTQTISYQGIESVSCVPPAASPPAAPPAPPPPGPSEAPAALVTLGRPTFADGAVRLPVTCVAEAQPACTGKVSLSTRVARRLVQAGKPTRVTVALGSKRFADLAPGARRVVVVPLGKRSRALLGRAGSLVVTATARVTDGRGVARTTTRAGTIRAPKPKPSRRGA